MLIIRSDLPAESDAIKLLDTVGVHARRLTLPVQLVLTTLTLDPVRIYMKWCGIGISQCFSSKNKRAFPIALIDKYRIYMQKKITYQVAN